MGLRVLFNHTPFPVAGAGNFIKIKTNIWDLKALQAAFATIGNGKGVSKDKIILPIEDALSAPAYKKKDFRAKSTKSPTR